jgi:thiamine-monophosphate kinase
VEAVAGVVDRAGEQGAELIGGDVAATGPGSTLALVVTVLGRRAGGAAGSFVTRTGGRAGDVLCLTGAIGARGLPEPPDRLRAGAALAPFARAMIDVSDGLARDAITLAEASRCGLRMHLDAVPLAPDADDVVQAAGWGDDYELLAAIDPARLEAALAALARACPGLSLTPIGQLTDAVSEHEFLLRGARVQPGSGFVHR